MKTILIYLISLTSLAGCAKKDTDTAASAQVVNTVTAAGATNYSYLALGDSYTIGESVDQSASFPYQLKTRLAASGIAVADPKIIAVTGWTTRNLISAVAQANLNQKYSLVTLLIGVNNQYQGLSQSDYRTELVQLLNMAIGFAGSNKQRVFVLSIPDYSVTPFAQNYDKAKIAAELEQFNAICKDESTRAGVNYLNITDISRKAADDVSLVAFDGLHPSGKMYGLWTDQLAPLVAAQLK